MVSPPPRQSSVQQLEAAKPYASASISSTGETTKTTTANTASSQTSSSTLEELDKIPKAHLPKLIVFDLDNTLWTPELYQIRQRNIPVVDKDIRLFPGAKKILEYCAASKNKFSVPLAVASRTSKTTWAERLLQDFTVNDKQSIKSLFAHIEIQAGSKKQHFARLRHATGFDYSEMLFIDDDARMNLNEISSQLGVLCCHTPRGVTVDYFVKAIQRYAKLTQSNEAWMGYILNADNLDILDDDKPEYVATAGRQCIGRVKFYSAQKKFGFVTAEDDDVLPTGADYFFHESKIPMGMTVNTGDRVKFEVLDAPPGSKKGPSAVILSSAADTVNGSGGGGKTQSTDTATVTMKCFSMSQPFASLLLHGCKTVESRNNRMFEDLAEGTKLLLHCGRRDWNDQESYQEIMNQAGYSPKEIQTKSRLPRGYQKGMVIGVVTIGKTWLSTEQERRGSQLQHQVLAPAAGIGKYCTEITRAQWLKKPVQTRGNKGIYEVKLPKDCLPPAEN